ncbi:MAG: hypothetical protein ABI690_30290 [Chloroflexota bacterium]
MNFLAGGIYFAWTPSEHYVAITTDNRVTSHGCDEVLVYSGDGRELVYSGDGRELVYSSVPTSVCSVLEADFELGVQDLCANDDILLTSGERITPATGVKIPTQALTCAG